MVASFEVIRHLFASADFIRQCARLLSPGGLLILTQPNIKGFDRVVLRALSATMDSEHLNYFYPACLSRLVEAKGLEVLEVETPWKLDAELVRHEALTGELDLSGQPFLRRVLVHEWDPVELSFQRFLADAGLSSQMWLACRRSR
jgi:SAM-dependent methyltransferase